MEDPNFAHIAKPFLPQDSRIYTFTDNWIGGLLTNWEDIQAYILETEDFYRKYPPNTSGENPEKKGLPSKISTPSKKSSPETSYKTY